MSLFPVHLRSPSRTSFGPICPMDKAVVALGDHLWSIGKVTSERQSRNDLEAGLQSLPVIFYVASASEWDRATKARNPNVANSFRPRLKKVSLTAF